MQQDMPRRPGVREQYAAFTSWLALLCQALEASVVVFLRRDFGRRYFGVQSAAVIPLVLVYSLFWEGHDIRPLFWFLGAFLLAQLLARARMLRRDRVTQHSHYSGEPSVLRWRLFRGRVSERRAKLTVEPVMVLLTGIALLPVSEPLGTYLMLAAAGLMGSMQLSIAWERTRLMDLQDAYIEQRHFAERFREKDLR